MAHPDTEDVVVVTKTEFEKVWSNPRAVASGVPWLLATDPKVAGKATKEKIAEAARVAGVELPDDSDAAEVDEQQLVDHITHLGQADAPLDDDPLGGD